MTPRERRRSVGGADLVLGALLCFVVLIGCSAIGVGLRPALHVGVAPTYPPLIFEEEGELVGIEVDLARLVADEIGQRLVFHRYPFDELFDALDRGEVDVLMSGLSISPERSKRVRFTEPYMEAGLLALIRTKDAGRLGRPRWIRRAGTRVGYERGTTGEDYVAGQLTRARSFGFDTVADGLRCLRAGRIDYFVHDAPTIWRLAGDPAYRDLIGLYRPLTQEHLAWAVRPDDTERRELLDTVLARLRREGLIEPIVNHWIPVRVRVP